MEWKAWTLVLGLGMLVLAVIGLIVHSDVRLVGADIVGAATAMIVILLAGSGRRAAVVTPIIGSVVMLVMAILAMQSHGSPVLIALTLAFAFALAFLGWQAASGRRFGGERRPPRPA